MEDTQVDYLNVSYLIACAYIIIHLNIFCDVPVNSMFLHLQQLQMGIKCKFFFHQRILEGFLIFFVAVKKNLKSPLREKTFLLSCL